MKNVKDNNYIMHSTYNEHFKLLTDAELGRLIRDVNNYVENGVLPQYSNEERVLNMAFSFMKATIDIEKARYQKKCKTNKENGSKGGAPKGNKNALKKQPNGLENNPKQPNGLENKPIDIDIDNDIDIGIGIDNDIDNKKSVCNKNAHAKEIICHLGSVFKDESCFRCMKKYKCKLPASPAFKLDHDESFEEWNDRKDALYEQWCNDRRSRGESTDIELFDYDWLNDR